MKRYILWLVILVILIGGAFLLFNKYSTNPDNGASEVQSNANVYVNDKLGINFEVPEDWSYDENDSFWKEGEVFSNEGMTTFGFAVQAKPYNGTLEDAVADDYYVKTYDVAVEYITIDGNRAAVVADNVFYTIHKGKLIDIYVDGQSETVQSGFREAYSSLKFL